MRTNHALATVSVFALFVAPPADVGPTERTSTITSWNGTRWRVRATATVTLVTRTRASSSWTVQLAGSWELPVVTGRGQVAGPSNDGTTLVLAPPTAAKTSKTASTTTFAVIADRRSTQRTLPGRWSFDAISPNGRTMYGIEELGGGQYWVRSVDLRTGRPGDILVTKTITDGREAGGVEEGPMSGLPLDRLVSADGHTVFTLYDGPKHPFIHALDTSSGSALCYELPSSLRAKARQLRIRLGAQKGLVDVTERDAVVAQIAEPTSLYGPSIRMPGSDRPPVVTP